MANTQQTLDVINASISLVSSLIPGVEALVIGLKTIWLAKNPTKTEAEWIASLASDSAQLTTEADAQLAKDGYVKGPDGEWVAPPVK